MRKILLTFFLTLTMFLFTEGPSMAKQPNYEGYKKCGGCHKSQTKSWLQTKHAKTFKVLKPNVEAKAKKKAKLDPGKDYTKDPKCLPCHVTGYKKMGGYKPGMSKAKAKYLEDVGCEMCHGAGSLFRKEHSKAGRKFKKEKKHTDRKVLVKAGQNFNYEEACNSCHLNYKGSGWKGVHEPYTPFTPSVDKKYKFVFKEAVREAGEGKAMHEHFKLRGVFSGKEPPLRKEFQKEAKEPEPGEEEEE